MPNDSFPLSHSENPEFFPLPRSFVGISQTPLPPPLGLDPPWDTLGHAPAPELAHPLEVRVQTVKDSSSMPVARLRLLRYGHQALPEALKPFLREVPAHLDVKGLHLDEAASLHTEYSSKARRFDSPFLDGLDSLRVSHRNRVPELWSSVEWAREYAVLMMRLVAGGPAPRQIEIHPPFISSAAKVEVFLSRYEVFEAAIHAEYPDCGIVLENRTGTKHPHPFLMSSSASILAMGLTLQQSQLKLGIALDLPQMFTAEFGTKHLVGLEGVPLIEQLLPIQDRIHTLHLWGRGAGGGAHGGGLDGLFDAKGDAKRACLQSLRSLLSDGEPRHLVIEVRRGGDVAAIIQDLEQAGFVMESAQ